MKRTLIVLAIALLALAGMLMKQRSTDKSRSSDAFALDSTWKAKVNDLRVVKKPDTSGLSLRDGNWVVAKDGFKVDTAKIHKVLGHIFSLQNKEIVSNNPARLAEYGLDTVEGKHVTVKDAAGKTVAVVIGKTSGADYSSTYWKWEDKPDVYRSPGNFTWEIATKDEDWKDRKLFSATAKDVKFVETTWKDSSGTVYSYKLEAVTDSTWKMLLPQDSNRVKNAMATEMATRFAEMSIDEFTSPKDTNLAKVKLDTPAVLIKIGLKNGSTQEIKATKAMDGYAYIQHPTRKDTLKLSSWRFDTFKKKPFELLDAPPAPKPDSSHPAAAQGGIKNEPVAAKPEDAAATVKAPASPKPAQTIQVKPAAPAPLQTASKAEPAKPATPAK